MAEDLTIRRMAAEDGPAWQRVFASVGNEGLWIGAETPVSDQSAETIRMYVGSVIDAMFLACIADEVIGWISAETGADGQIELGMGIEHAYRGRGIGSALMETVIAWAGDRPLILRVFPHNDRARALYRKFGFVEMEDKAGVWPRRNGEFWDLIFMERVRPPI